MLSSMISKLGSEFGFDKWPNLNWEGMKGEHITKKVIENTTLHELALLSSDELNKHTKLVSQILQENLYSIQIEMNGKTSYKETLDYNKYGLIPGTRLARKGLLGSQYLGHYGIYVGNGLIYEVGGTGGKKTNPTHRINFKDGLYIRATISPLETFF
jgi:hypothetical protein